MTKNVFFPLLPICILLGFTVVSPVLRPGIVGMRGSTVIHSTTAMHDNEYPPPPVEGRPHTAVGECEMLQGGTGCVRRGEEETRQADECDMEEDFGTLDSSEQTIAIILENRWWSQAAKTGTG